MKKSKKAFEKTGNRKPLENLGVNCKEALK
jgi:hypothetical protein